MAFCTKCGKPLPEGTNTCPDCDAAAKQANKAKASGSFQEKVVAWFTKLTDTPDTTAAFDPEDIKSNKIVTLFAYVSLLISVPILGNLLLLIPILCAPKSKFARYHANQGLILTIAYYAIWLVLAIIGGIVTLLTGLLASLGGGIAAVMAVIGTLIGLVLSLLEAANVVCVLGLAIVGLINVVTDKAKELPYIGKYRILK